MPEPTPSLSASLLELMAAHRSVRSFKDQALTEPEVEASVRAAQQASTSSHVQAYQLLRVTQRATRERLAELTGGQPWIVTAGAFFVLAADLRRLRLASRLHAADHQQNFESFLVAAIDTALFAQNLALAFESKGLGICFIGGLRNRSFEVDALLEVPTGVLPLFGLCVGQPLEAGEPRPRLPLDAIYSVDRFPDENQLLEAIAQHDREMAEFYARTGRPGRDWSSSVAKKFTQRARAHLLEYYRSKGAELSP